ncbi:acyl-CoA carboxylase subunit beta [Desulfallas thermosapovorans]|uniref:Acetyl-CoA carboxylase carboxyltransferase component n=1 Tax=Desulfallas thermosapovorans DSM 6562 TaxID=1121431 RepID=A0A5S4ZNX8_9FIRM|nr:acyl-CoA carboxylase subunit beta [Desulfallas thermosapovorans]TYO93344.1 acetyl-CoA carboxylase carboxyltransferase component [Desulfallas thermosapovorans DSM 6562]
MSDKNLQALDVELNEKASMIKKGGAPKYHASNAKKGKLFARERLELLLDPGSITVEDGLWANNLADGLPADGVVTAVGKIHGRTVCVMANDSTVKAGSWGWRTVEKIIRIQETAMNMQVPMLYLVDSAGARITDQIEMFPGRRGAGRIFYNEVKMSGMVPQICLLFGPSAAGGAYIPAFCDVVFMVEGNASMYLGSPRMAEMVIFEKVTLEEMGGARMHCSVSGCGDLLAATEQEAIEACRRYLTYLPQNYREKTPLVHAQPPAPGRDIEEIVPVEENQAFDMYEVINRLIDRDSWFEIKKLFAPELITGLARIGGRAVGILANQSLAKGGVLFVDSADKAARFMNLCDAFNIPLLFLMDVPGFMIGSAVERQGIIRHGAKMISAMSEATVPKVSVVVRKAYGAGLYAMCGPAFEPDCCMALPSAMIAVMGPQAAVNAVYENKINALPPEERPAFVQQKREEYARDVDIYRLASELVVDHIVSGAELRDELIKRFALYESKTRVFTERKHPVYPV